MRSFHLFYLFWREDRKEQSNGVGAILVRISEYILIIIMIYRNVGTLLIKVNEVASCRK